MRTRGRLTVRGCGLLATAALAVTFLPGAAPARAAAAVSSPGVKDRPATTAWSAAVENAATGRLLWSRGLNTERPMASITKVMTAYLVIRAGHLDRAITIPAAVAGYVRAHNADWRRPAAGG